MAVTKKKQQQVLPLMPKATAIWLIDNTGLTFEQIAAFCGLHELEVQALADGDIAAGMQGANPLQNGLLNQAEITRCEADAAERLKANENQIELPERTGGPRYTPLTKRADKPDAVAWILRTHPEVPDHAIVKLLGTTKHTIQSIRDRTHWNNSNIRPRHPVALEICKQADLDKVLERYADKAAPKPAAASAPDSYDGDAGDKVTLPEIF
jgi:uncharacterized protein